MGASGNRSGLTVPQGAEMGTHAADRGAAAGDLGGEGDLFADVAAEADAMTGGTMPMPARRGAGRPPGTPNRSTALMREYMTRLGFRDPLMVLGQLASADVGDLAQALGCKKIEAADLVRKAAVDMLPYWHQALPKEVAVHHTGARPMIVIADGPFGKGEQVQGDSAKVIEGSHGERSHDGQ
jgi:hypothetical protein